ncbi:hypothetical protein [Comamonadaceae bacterium NML03-0146]|uniref:hypothetical protein n=1 Tax=Vandammella animalimorsus TaxID=2029117 RepID=UPI0011782DC6
MWLTAELLNLKHAHRFREKQVRTRWLGNLYWQLFIGEVLFQATRCRASPSSLTRWPQRLSKACMEEPLEKTIAAARAIKAVDASELSRLIVGSTVWKRPSPTRRQPPARCCAQRTVRSSRVIRGIGWELHRLNRLLKY